VKPRDRAPPPRPIGPLLRPWRKTCSGIAPHRPALAAPRSGINRHSREDTDEFMDTQTGVFHEDSFRHLLTREAGRATRVPGLLLGLHSAARRPRRTGNRLARRSSEPSRRRSRSLSGRRTWSASFRLPSRFILLHTAGSDALRVPSGSARTSSSPFARVRKAARSAHGERREGVLPARRHTDSILLSAGARLPEQATQRGGNPGYAQHRTPD